MAEKFTKGGQEGWFHDRGHWSGFFHTYDRFQVGGAGNQPRKIHIFLPRDYEFTQENYPVIYMNDGDTAFFPGGAYQKTWDMGKILTRLYLGNQICKVIVVAVCPINRDYEYTHAPVWGCQWGGLQDYSAYLAHSVKGFVDAHYRTLPDAEQTLIVGASHGGLAAFYTATQYPDKFRCVAAFSPSFWVGLDSTIEFSQLDFPRPIVGSLESSALLYAASQTLSDPNKRLKIYLDWGLIREGGDHNSVIEERATVRGRQMRDILVRDFGYRENENLFTVEDPLGKHEEESWSGRMENVLKIFFG
jgi:predicted alpha/beta superfamily hydrolase